MGEIKHHRITPSGKLLHNYGKSPFLVGKSTVNGHFQSQEPWTRNRRMSQVRRWYAGASSYQRSPLTLLETGRPHMSLHPAAPCRETCRGVSWSLGPQEIREATDEFKCFRTAWKWWGTCRNCETSTVLHSCSVLRLPIIWKDHFHTHAPIASGIAYLEYDSYTKGCKSPYMKPLWK